MENVQRINIPTNMVWNQFVAYMRLNNQQFFFAEVEGTQNSMIVRVEIPVFEESGARPQGRNGISYM
jgi:hypothetical protein